MAQQAFEAVQGCVSYGTGYISAGGPGESDILSSQIRPRMPLDFAQMAKQQARTVMPFPLNDGILAEAWMQLPPPYRSTLEACIDAYKCNKICPEDMVAFCRSMSSHSDVLCALFRSSDETPSWPMPGKSASSSQDSSSSSSSSLTSISSVAPGPDPMISTRASTSPQSDPQSSPSTASPPRGAKRQRGLTADDLAAQALIMLVSHVSPLKLPMPPPPSQPASLTLPPISLLLSGNDQGAASSSASHRESSSSASAGYLSSNASCSPKTTPSSPMNSSATGTAAVVASSSIGRPCMTKRSQPKAAATSSHSRPKSVPASQNDGGELPADAETLPTPLGAAANTKGTAGASHPSEEGAHNKYCHFCQHIKVKKASSMHACENRGCNRRFCDHCLTAHMKEEALDSSTSSTPWHCPICRKTCCCTMGDCGQTHRHCKAYRYRRKRAARAVAADSRDSEAPPSLAMFQAGQQQQQQQQLLAAGMFNPKHHTAQMAHELMFAFAAAPR